MPKLSAALLVYRRRAELEVLLVHPGGPFWARKDDGAWSIPKGEYLEPEEPRSAAYREFEEEVGVTPPTGEPFDLGTARLSSGKIVTCFAIEGDVDLDEFQSNTFELEWPRGSGIKKEFPEVDQAEWFSLERARVKLSQGQLPFLDRLLEQAQ
ncbi:MAG: NUDIX domain-containing protein [Marmoricola sp.]